jgi:hypothetical protein
VQSSAAFCAYGLFRWRLNPGDYEYEEAFRNILAGTVSTISDYEKNYSDILVLTQQQEKSLIAKNLALISLEKSLKTYQIKEYIYLFVISSLALYAVLK